MGENDLIYDDLVFYVNDGKEWEAIPQLKGGTTYLDSGLFIEGDLQKENIMPLAEQRRFSFKFNTPSCPSRKVFS